MQDTREKYDIESLWALGAEHDEQSKDEVDELMSEMKMSLQIADIKPIR